MKVAVKNLQNKEVGSLDLNPAVFGVPVRADVLHRMVHYQLNKRRAGTHDTKGVSEVSGTGKKPWRQKGTGRARFGNLRAPQFRGGTTIFGPTPRSHATELPKKFRALALRTALSSKAAEGKLVVLDNEKIDSYKTKGMVDALKKLGLSSALVVCGADIDANFARATRNIPLIDVLPSQGANVYDILRRDTLVLTKDAVDTLTKRLTDEGKEG